MIVKENNVQNEAVQLEETLPEQNLEEKNAEIHENIPVADVNNIDTQSEAYFEAVKKLEAEKKDKKKKIFISVLLAIAIILVSGFVISLISEQIAFNKQVDTVSAEIESTGHGYTETYKKAVDAMDKDQNISDKKKAKEFFILGKKADEFKKSFCSEDLFNRCIEKNESYKEKVQEYVYNAMSSAEKNEEVLTYAEYYVSLGKTLDETTKEKISLYLYELIDNGSFGKYSANIKLCEELGVKLNEEELNEKIYNAAMKEYNAKEYEDAYAWFGIYTGNKEFADVLKDIKYNISITYVENDNDVKAYELLEELGDYKYSKELGLWAKVKESKYDYESARKAVENVRKALKYRLKNPYSYIESSSTYDIDMRIFDYSGLEVDFDYDIKIYYSATNSFGARISDTYSESVSGPTFSANWMEREELEELLDMTRSEVVEKAKGFNK